MRMMTLIAISALSITAAAPGIAQDAMMKDGKKMSAAETKKMNACNAMSHEKMMKNKGCAAMMKAHPDMMKHDDMMKKPS